MAGPDKTELTGVQEDDHNGRLFMSDIADMDQFGLVCLSGTDSHPGTKQAAHQGRQ